MYLYYHEIVMSKQVDYINQLEATAAGGDKKN